MTSLAATSAATSNTVTTNYSYDALNRLSTAAEANTGPTQYNYDEVGNRISQTDANQHTTRFEYDQLGRRSKRTLPVGQFETFTYNASVSGQLLATHGHVFQQGTKLVQLGRSE